MVEITRAEQSKEKINKRKWGQPQRPLGLLYRSQKKRKRKDIRKYLSLSYRVVVTIFLNSMGNMCTPVADACWCMAKSIQYCKVKNNNNILKKRKPLKKKKKTDKSLARLIKNKRRKTKSIKLEMKMQRSQQTTQKYKGS